MSLIVMSFECRSGIVLLWVPMVNLRPIAMISMFFHKARRPTSGFQGILIVVLFLLRFTCSWSFEQESMRLGLQYCRHHRGLSRVT